MRIQIVLMLHQPPDMDEKRFGRLVVVASKEFRLDLGITERLKATMEDSDTPCSPSLLYLNFSAPNPGFNVAAGVGESDRLSPRVGIPKDVAGGGERVKRQHRCHGGGAWHETARSVRWSASAAVVEVRHPLVAAVWVDNGTEERIR